MIDTSPDELNLMRYAWMAYPQRHAAFTSQFKWQPYEWLEYVGTIIAQEIMKGNGRVIVNAPPRHGKSEFISFRTPCWFLDRWPDKKVVMCSYGDALASDFGRMVRNEVSTNEMIDVVLREDSKAVGRWNTPQGGGMICAGVDGPITGKGGDLLIIDDPIKNWADAWSYSKRMKQIDWFNGTFYTRCEPNATIVVLMTRWHSDDLCGYLIEEHEDDWIVINLPAMCESTKDLLGRAIGDALCPQRYDNEAIARIKRVQTQGVWDALYQQKPADSIADAVYSAFTQENEDSTIAHEKRFAVDVSFDFNINPGMHAVIGYENRVIDEIYALEVIHGPRMRVKECVLDFIKWCHANGLFNSDHKTWNGKPVRVFGDATSQKESELTTESAYQIIYALLQKANIPYRAMVKASNPPRRTSIDGFNDALCDISGIRHYKVHPRCKILTRDFKNLKTDEFGDMDKSDILLSHASDAERYRVFRLRPLNIKPRMPQGRFSVKVR